ncbi:hypothetical protein [Pelomonas sp. Root1237]|uniref:hypothetical protein n=1 Tax=Pelomonas sp. Root1237 TaxID=1736434 RepID=UPI0006FA9C86|nr:hypothetical protein [Pelomonas sp. Root1237]KQV94841.1 hypothetical protein ASC91_26570 [Pelomonas sp. Root1237]
MRTLAVTIASLVTALPAFAADTPASHAQAVLHDGCAQAYASHVATYYAAGAVAPTFTGERPKGDHRYYNDAKPCDEAQFASYLEKADPATVTMAYPTAAGKAKSKKANAVTTAAVPKSK